MPRKNTLRLLILALLGFIAQTCNTTEPGPDTLDYYAHDSLKFPNFDSLQLYVYVVRPPKDTVYSRLVFHGPYKEQAQLRKMVLGRLPSDTFSVYLIAFRKKIPALIMNLPFVGGKAGKMDTIMLPTDTTHLVNHRPIVTLAGADSGKTSFSVKEGATLTFTLAVKDTDSGDAAGLQSLIGTYCGAAVLDTVTKVFSFKPAYSCADSSTDSLDYNVKFQAKDRGNPPLSDTLTIRIVVLDSIGALDVVINSPANGFVTRDTVVAVRWSVDGVVQTAQTLESLTKEGANTIKRHFTDSLGSSALDSITIIRDRIPPNKPVVTGPGLTNKVKPTWTWTSGGNGNGFFRFKIDTALLSDTVGSNNLVYTPNEGLFQGNHTLYIQERDAAGNWSEMANATAIVDTILPKIIIQSPRNKYVTSRSFVTVSWTLDGMAQTDISQVLVDGENTVKVYRSDSAGNVGEDSIKVFRRSNVIFVRKGSNGDGSSWENAKGELGDVMDLQTVYPKGTQVWVAKGTYAPTVTYDSKFKSNLTVNPIYPLY